MLSLKLNIPKIISELQNQALTLFPTKYVCAAKLMFNGIVKQGQ